MVIVVNQIIIEAGDMLNLLYTVRVKSIVRDLKQWFLLADSQLKLVGHSHGKLGSIDIEWFNQCL